MTSLSDRHTEERALRALLDAARLSAMSEVAADIAHELNQPLAAIANYAVACERMLSGPAPDLTEIREAQKQIAAQALRAGESIRRLRDLVRHRQQDGADAT